MTNGNIIVLICLAVGFVLLCFKFGNYKGVVANPPTPNIIDPETRQYYQSQIQARKESLQAVPNTTT
uniref:Uncharacterized protein n=1 Tax=Panagrolaimus sp. JU765 TaxID=591449 RepID=A0AC34PXM3_9BILA